MSGVSTAAPTELGTLKIGKLLRMYAVPGIIAQTAASLYNIVDSIYIGHIPGVGGAAISGLAVTFPLMNLSVALGTLVGVGAMTIISVYLGQRKYDSAQKVLSNVLTLNVIIGAIFTAIVLPFLDPILRFFGASDVTLPYAHDYMFIIILGNTFTHLMHGFNGVIRCSGHPMTAMGLTLFTVISNAILDPIFIFTLHLGIKGAALATILCQLIALAYSLIFLADKKRFLHFPRPLFQLDRHIAGKSLAIGLSPFLMNAASCIVAIFINQQMGRYGGDDAIGSFGIVNRFTMFFAMICLGFNQGLQPIAGYNYGARQFQRVKDIFVLVTKWEVLVTVTCFLLSVLCPRFAISLFINMSDPANAGIAELAPKGLRLINCGFALVGFGMATSHFFQSLGLVKTSIFLSLTRQLLFLLPLLYTLPLIFGQTGVWLSFPIADTLNIFTSAFFITRLFRNFDKLDGSV